MFVCATSGVSQVIDPHGMVQASMPACAEGTLTGTMRRESGITFYTRAGWLTPWFVLAIAGLCWLVLLLPQRKMTNPQF